MRLVYAFNHDGDDENDLDAEETLTALAVDWANDSHGDGDVDYEDFLDSVFELARKWAEDEGERAAAFPPHRTMPSFTRAHAPARAQTETGTSTRTIWRSTCRIFSSASSVTT